MVDTKRLDSYIEKCFKDAFLSEEREYNKKLYSGEYVIIYDSKNVGHFYPVMSCKYDRILRRVDFRLENNIKKNFDLVFKDSEDFRCSVDSSAIIDFNFTRAMIADRNNTKKKYEIFILDDLDKFTYKKGQYIPSYKYEQLVRKYYNLEEKDYYRVGDKDDGISLPSSLMTDWNEFKKLWKATFDQDICPYKIILSAGLVRL